MDDAGGQVGREAGPSGFQVGQPGPEPVAVIIFDSEGNPLANLMGDALVMALLMRSPSLTNGSSAPSGTSPGAGRAWSRRSTAATWSRLPW